MIQEREKLAYFWGEAIMSHDRMTMLGIISITYGSMYPILSPYHLERFTSYGDLVWDPERLWRLICKLAVEHKKDGTLIKEILDMPFLVDVLQEKFSTDTGLNEEFFNVARAGMHLNLINEILARAEYANKEDLELTRKISEEGASELLVFRCIRQKFWDSYERYVSRLDPMFYYYLQEECKKRQYQLVVAYPEPDPLDRFLEQMELRRRRRKIGILEGEGDEEHRCCAGKAV